MLRMGEMPQAVMLDACAREMSRVASRAGFRARLFDVAHEELAFATEGSSKSELKKQPLVTLPLFASVIFRSSCKYPGAKMVEASSDTS